MKKFSKAKVTKALGMAETRKLLGAAETPLRSVRVIANRGCFKSISEIDLQGSSEADLLFLHRSMNAIMTKFAEAEKKHNWQSAWLKLIKADAEGMLFEHLEKGDPIDVAIICLFFHHFGWSTEKVLERTK